MIFVNKLFMRLCFLFSTSALIAISSPSIAARIVPVDDQNCQLSISRDIKKGDFKKFVSMAKLFDVKTVCLNSPGGSWIEGVNISEYLMDNFIGTYIVENAECFSACALIFLGGARIGLQPKYNGNGFEKVKYRFPDRTMHVKSKVGFHAPFLSLKRRQYSVADVHTARLAALQAFAKFLGLLVEEKK